MSGAEQDPGSPLATAALAKAFMGLFNREAEGTTGTRLYMDEQDNVRLALETVLGTGLDEALKAQVAQVLAELETPEVRHYQVSEEGEDYATVAKTMPVPAKDARAAAAIRALLGVLATRQAAATPAGARTWIPLMGTSLAVRRDVLDEDQARANHSQTLDRLAQRGGLDPAEALAVAQGRGLATMGQGSQDEALVKLAALVARRR